MWELHRKQAGVQGIAHAQTIRALSFDTDYSAWSYQSLRHLFGQSSKTCADYECRSGCVKALYHFI